MELLSVVLGVLINENEILLLKRNKDPYQGYWSLPGGKIESNEHISEAVTRELFEETGIKTTFHNHLGVVSEHLIEDENSFHFLLHVCELKAEEFNLIESEEGELNWFNLDQFENLKNKMIASDYLMVEKFVKNKEKNYYDCVVKKEGDDLVLKKFK